MSHKDHLRESPLDSAPPVNLVQIQGIKKKHWVPSRYNARATNGDGSTVIWNTYTGAMNVFEPKDRAGLDKLLRRRGFIGELKGLSKYLYERGYLVAQETNEYRQVQLMAGQQQYRTDVLELILLASEDCNFRCVYCYEDFQRGTMGPAVREAIKKLVRKRAPDLKDFVVSWFGGEPLYGFKAIEDLAPFFVEISEEYSINFFGSHMTTNGYLLTPEVAEKLLAWRITDFQITLDGLAEQHDAKRPTRDGCKTFEMIHSNLQSLQKRQDQFGVTIRINFDRENYGQLESLLELMQKDFSGDERFTLSFHRIGKWGGPNDAGLSVCGTSESRSVTRNLKQSALDKGLNIGSLQNTSKPGEHVCYAARPYNFIIGADGTLMKCTIVLDKKDYNVVGKITDEGDLDLDFNKYALWTEPAFESDSTCRKCYMLPSCQGMYCPWIRMEQETQPCPTVKENIRGELLTSLEINRMRARAHQSRIVSQEDSIQAEEKKFGPEESGVASPAQNELLYFLQAGDFRSDEARIKSLSADDLAKESENFYPYFYLNLLSILGGRLPLEQIRRIAVESLRGKLLEVSESLRSLSELLELARLRASEQRAELDRDLIKLRGWDLDLIGSLLRRGRGLIFCSHHLGPHRFLTQDLALMGFKISLMLDEVSFNQSYSLLEHVKWQFQSETAKASQHIKGLAGLGDIRMLNILNVQNKESVVSALKALKRGESIFVYADGNSGWDGDWGSSAKSVIDFLGFPVAVKHGIARLAAAFGTPILPLVTLRSKTDFGRVIFGSPIIPPSDMTSEERDKFVIETMNSIYKLLEEHALESIEQWSSSCFLHRWRIPARQSPVASPSSSELEDIEKQLGLGKSFKLNEQKISPLTVKDEIVLVDVQTLKIYKVPEESGNLFLRLSQKGELKGSDISALNGGLQARQKVLSLLDYLIKLQVLIPG